VLDSDPIADLDIRPGLDRTHRVDASPNGSHLDWVDRGWLAAEAEEIYNPRYREDR
jgi:hypothetical protein